MTHNDRMRYCGGCGLITCAVCGRRPPSLRQDTVNLARATGSQAGACFWGILAAIVFVFWPSIFMHGPHKGTVQLAWLGFIALFCVYSFIMWTRQQPMHAPREYPDLRDSDEFSGT